MRDSVLRSRSNSNATLLGGLLIAVTLASSSAVAAPALRATTHLERRAAASRDAPPWTLDDDDLLGSIAENRSFVPLLQVGDVVPDEPLIDQFGKPLSLRQASGLSIITFVYTRCADERACPLVTAKFARLAHLLSGTGIRLVELTLDAKYDRPLVLRRYAEAAGATNPNRWAIGTGRPDDLFALSQRFGILRSRAANGGFAHTNVVAIVTSSGRLQTSIAGDEWSPDDLAAKGRDESRLPSDSLRLLGLALFARVSAACGTGGTGGATLLGALTIFVSLAFSIAWLIVRLFGSAFTR